MERKDWKLIMKKAGKIFVGTTLGIMFAGVVGMYCWQYDVGGIQKFFTEKETESGIKQPKLKVPEKKIYELGEEVECDGLTWTITSAEIIEDYNSLDGYYHARPQGLINPAEWVKSNHMRYFEEEVQFLVLRATITNTSQVHKEYSCSGMQFYNSYKDGEFEDLLLGSYASDIKCVSKTGEIKQIEENYASFSIESGETVEVEYIEEYCEYSGYEEEKSYIYDLYLSTLSLSPNKTYYKGGVENKIHLNIAPKHMGIDHTEPQNTYDEQRNVPEMKCRQWTNLDMKNYQEEGYPTLYEKEDVVKEYEEEVTEENYLFDKRGINTQLSGAKVVDWETLPRDFADREALQKMAECYEQSYGYSKNQMKILLLDINFIKPIQDKSVKKEYDSVVKVDFYPWTYLYTRDKNEKRWVFGTADDWIVTENRTESGRTGHINAEHIAEGQSVTLQAAYLLPPEIYNEGALYFNGGEYIDIDYSEQPIQKIELK